MPELQELLAYECNFCHRRVDPFRYAWVVGDNLSCGCHLMQEYNENKDWRDRYSSLEKPLTSSQ